MYNSPVCIISWHRLELIFSKKFKRTKTGFERRIMQITIAIKGALSSVTVHLYKEWSKEKVKTRRHEANHRSHEAEQERKSGKCDLFVG
ncbi:hypothetical protein T4E_3423 [Trichinella pseudospiralis]|uniref:Uncharacterized protein n=1 Tax=Trichinella pseudospiralis TaxID=6337 RepID=A0A0V0XG63_TRIPS|nr:hypothetical protein T4E_10224 [Trichinella pseudospiralis]KRX89551.1 hypothetical protein T4E_3423 [Trichinella pseudospiralis]